MVPGRLAATMGFWQFVNATQEHRCDYQGMVRAVLKKAGHKSFGVGEQCKESSRGKDEIDLVVKAADVRSMGVFAFFGGGDVT